MSSTRHATDDNFHQERYCSAAEFEKGLLANLVAKRCEMLREPKDRELVWFLQLLSHRESLEATAAHLVGRFRAQIGTASMRRFGMKAGQVYNREQADAICREVVQAGGECQLVGDKQQQDQGEALRCQAKIARELAGLERRRRGQAPERAAIEEPRKPAPGYNVESFFNLKHITTDELPKLLARICTDPGRTIESFTPWYFPSLVQCLRTYMAERIDAQRTGLVQTEMCQQVCDNLDCVLESGGMIVLEGPPLRIGKSFAGRTWCDLHPGLARFVQVPATNDDIGFFRAIAEAIGSASALSFKGVQLRERVEMTLQSSKLMLVLDNAHYLWPQNNRREALPNRLNWLLTALVNHGVPVALVTTPQFARDQNIVVSKTGWTSAQFLSQIGEYKKLPSALSTAELTAIAKCYLPTCDSGSIENLALYAQGSGRYLSAIEAVGKRARFLAGKEGRAKVTSHDIEKARSDYVMPSDEALKEALAQSTPRRPAAPADGTNARTLQPGRFGRAAVAQPLRLAEPEDRGAEILPEKHRATFED